MQFHIAPKWQNLLDGNSAYGQCLRSCTLKYNREQVRCDNCLEKLYIPDQDGYVYNNLLKITGWCRTNHCANLNDRQVISLVYQERNLDQTYEFGYEYKSGKRVVPVPLSRRLGTGTQIGSVVMSTNVPKTRKPAHEEYIQEQEKSRKRASDMLATSRHKAAVHERNNNKLSRAREERSILDDLDSLPPELKAQVQAKSNELKKSASVSPDGSWCARSKKRSIAAEGKYNPGVKSLYKK